jgi:hypothetical protein
MDEYENGFCFRNKFKKTQLKVINKILPFSIVSKKKTYSKRFYGIEPIHSLNFDLPAEKLTNTNYVSFDYEKHCKQQLAEFEFSKNETIGSNTNWKKCKILIDKLKN